MEAVTEIDPLALPRTSQFDLACEFIERYKGDTFTSDVVYCIMKRWARQLSGDDEGKYHALMKLAIDALDM